LAGPDASLLQQLLRSDRACFTYRQLTVVWRTLFVRRPREEAALQRALASAEHSGLIVTMHA
jgi:hypothetical protein